MTTAFPTGLDSLNNPNGTTDKLNTSGRVHNVQHSDANDAIEALEAKVGVNSSAVTTSLDYRVAQLEAGGGDWDATILKQATDTVTNDATLTSDSELSIDITGGKRIILIEFCILYSGTAAAANYKWLFILSGMTAAADMQGWHSTVTTAEASSFANAIGSLSNGTWPAAAVAVGTPDGAPLTRPRAFHGRFQFTSNDGVRLLATYQFAQNTQTAGQSVSTLPGSFLRYRSLATWA